MRLARAVVGLLVAVPALAQDIPNPPRGTDRNDWESYYQRGVELLRRRRARNAVPYFEHAARLEPMVAEPWLGLIAAYWRDHDDLARRRAERDPLLDRMDEVQEANGWLDRAFAINPFAPLGVLSYAVPPGYTYSDRDALDRGTAAFMLNDFAKAARELDDAIAQHPDHLEAYHWRAMARFHRGNYEGAVHDLETLIDSVETFRNTYTIYGPSDASSLYYMLALLAARANDRRRAIPAFEHALTDDLTNPWAHLHFANTLWRMRDTTRALTEYEAAVALAPDEPAVVASYGTALLGVGRAEAALTQFDHAVELDPWWARPRYNRAVCLERLGRGPDAYRAWGEYLVRAAQRETEQRATAEARLEALRQ